MKKIILSVFCCLLTYHTFAGPFSGLFASPNGVGKLYSTQQGFSDLPKLNSEKQFKIFATKEIVAPLKFIFKKALEPQSRIYEKSGSSLLRLNSLFFIPLPLSLFNFYSLVILLLTALLVAMAILWYRQYKSRRYAEAGETFFRGLIDEAPMGMVIFQNLKIEYVNPVLEELTGFSQPELQKMEIWQLIHPESRSGLQADNWFLLKNNPESKLEFRLNTKIPKEVRVEFSARLVDFFGKPGFIATVAETTKKSFEASLPAPIQTVAKKETDIYKHFFEQAQSVLLIFERDSEKIENANESACNYYGYAIDELKGMPLQQIQLSMFRVAGSENHLVGFHKLKDGQIRDVEVFNSQVEDNGRKLVLSMVIDITDRKRTERDLKEARELAEEALKAKSQFISGISHEIRTPLNSIIGLADLLLSEEPQNELMSENLRSIKFSSNHLLGIINEVLDFSKLEAGKVDIEKSDFNLEQLVNETSKVLEYRAIEKGVQLRVNINPNVPHTIIADQGHLRQVILNLVGNAIKFTSEGHIDVYVKMLEKSGHTCRLKFSVSDTGIGIPEEKLNSIFESYTQANTNTYRKFGGTGLGLTISKKLVELQGGEMGVKSIEGIGSTFWFELPVGISEKRIETVASMALGPKDLKAMRILLVEDDRMNQFVMSQFLRKWNARVEVVENGRAAVELLSREIFDLVLMDIHMPEMDGFEAAGIIRDRQSMVIDHQVPIIALTGDINPETRARVREAGMNDFITKPSEPEVLFQKVAEYTLIETESIADPSLKNAGGLAPLGYEIKEVKREVKVALREIFDDNHTATASMIGHFIKRIPLTLQTVNEHLEVNEGEQAASALHRIKPGFHYLGFKATATKIEELQELIRKARAPGDIRQHMLMIEKDVKKIMHVLNEILQEIELNETDET